MAHYCLSRECCKVKWFVRSQQLLEVRDGSIISYAGNKNNVFIAIDEMGAASAKAQGLSTVITTAKRLINSDHHLYILKDPAGNQDRGSLVGILKVGRKKLFVYDIQGQQHELDPLCVLDFYVHESKQRQGCGRQLFDAMLREEKILSRHLAVDRPSAKFMSFLSKHYNLKDVIPQMNNYVVFNSFFRDRIDPAAGDSESVSADMSKKPSSHKDFTYNNSPAVRPLSAVYGNQSAVHISARGDGIRPGGENKSPTAIQKNVQMELKQLQLEDPKQRPWEQYSRHSTTSNQGQKQQQASNWPMKSNGERAPSPPLLSREGPPRDYLNFGQSRTDSNTRQPQSLPAQPVTSTVRMGPLAALPPQSPAYRQVHSTSTGGGGGAHGYTYNTGLQRNYSHTRLW